MAGYVNKTRKNDISYDIHDKRMPDITDEDIGKVPVIGENGNFEYANGGSGGSGTGGGVYEVCVDDFEVETYNDVRALGDVPIKIKIIGEDLITAIEEGYDLVIDMGDEDLANIFSGCDIYAQVDTVLRGKFRFKLSEATSLPFGNNGGGELALKTAKNGTRSMNDTLVGATEVKNYTFMEYDGVEVELAMAYILIAKINEGLRSENWYVKYMNYAVICDIWVGQPTSSGNYWEERTYHNSEE